MSFALGAVIIGSIISGIAAATDIAINADQASKNRAMQKEMAQNNIKYSVQQAQDLGISPSLVLGDTTHALGGTNSNVSNSAGAMTNAVNGALKYDLEKQRLETMEEIQEDKLAALKDIYNTSSASITNKKISKEELDNLYSDLKKVEI